MPPDQQRMQIAIEDEMRTSYLDYAMSVIVGRALPDIRDGLKPVHRRILYGMHEMGLHFNRSYRKSAKLVGEIMGNYHPHGDAAIYDTLVRMAQEFNMRYPLVDGQGNFGSVDGDPPAAMRYTEARLTRLAGEMLADIDLETVDFVPNYDESTSEPVVLPTRVPNLLVNGSAGIAVGMATNIPPHNLGEIIDGLVVLLEQPEATVERLMEAITGPDFPTAAFIYGTQGIRDAYMTGRGSVTMRARAEIESDPKTDRSSIIVSELPFQVNKARLLEKIAELVQERRIEGIADLRDESDREGTRVVVELKRGEIPAIILNQLYKHTQLQTTFGINMVALVNNEPRVLNLKELLQGFLDHRREVVIRRTWHQLRKAEERAHILEGLKIALDNLDAVVMLIRRASSPEEARTGLREQYLLSEAQANAILDMKLQRLTQLEREKLMREYEEILQRIEYLRSVLESETKVRQIVKEELEEIRTGYRDDRRTEILREEAELSLEDLIAPEEMVVTISHVGYIKRTPSSMYRSQHRGGRGRLGMGVKEEDFVERLFVASTHDVLLCFTDAGKVYWIKVHQLPEAGRATKGKAIVNLLALSSDERVTAVLPVKEFRDDCYVISATRRGMVKKTPLSAYANPRVGGIIAQGLDEGDRMISVQISDGRQEVLLGTKQGLAIRFNEREVRPMGRAAHGVRGIHLDEGNELIGMEILTPEEDASVLTVTEGGYGKRTPVGEYRLQSRGGKGIISIKTTERNGSAVGFLRVQNEDEIVIMSMRGNILRCKVSSISEIGRNTQGVRILDMEDEDDRVVGLARLAENVDPDGGGVERSAGDGEPPVSPPSGAGSPSGS